MTDVLYILAACAAGILLLLLVLTFITYLLTFRRRSRPLDVVRDLGIDIERYRDVMVDPRELDARPHERVTVSSYDGLTLVARYYHASDDAPVNILFHGYKSSPLCDFSGGIRLAHGMGHNVLLVYQRSHGESEGGSITFGDKESRDVLSWVGYVSERFGREHPIVLTGISMGASTVLLASALEMPGNVRCVVADCPYSSPKEIIKRTVKGMHLPPSLVYPFIRLGGKIFARFDPSAVSCVRAAASSRLPILLIHGDADGFVPRSMSDEIYAAHTGRMDYRVFPNADHGMSYLEDAEEYERTYRSFVSEFTEKRISNEQ